MPHRKSELERIIEDLEHFVHTTCEYDPKDPKGSHDFVGEKCNDAYLMLQEVNNELAAKLKAEQEPPKSR